MSAYLDFNASTPTDERVINVMLDVYRNNYGNPDSITHYYGENARKTVESARGYTAALLGVKKDEVFFTGGATESDNIAVLGLRKYAGESGKKHIITTAIEHKAVLEPIGALEKNGFDVTYISPDNTGRIDADEVLGNVRGDTLLVSVMHVNNETGIIQPVDVIGEELEKSGVLFHIDAAQSCGKLVDELKNIRYDMLSVSAHKMYGPQGVGALILRKKRYKLPPVSAIMYGGGQERGIRPGTVPAALTAGFGEACRIALSEYKENNISCRSSREKILSMLDEAGVLYELNGSSEFCIPNTLNISFTGVNSEALMLAARQYCGISNGSACNSSSYKPSYVLKAMGLSEERIRSAVRISFGHDGGFEEDLAKLIGAVKKLA